MISADLQKAPEVAKGGRKSAYVARNRNRIIQAAQRVMAESGAESTIEAVSEVAEIAVSTIYKHFETRDALFEAALAEAMYEWEHWAFDQVGGNDSELERFVKPIRLLLRIQESHPLYARIIATNPNTVLSAMPTLTAHMSHNARALAKAGVLEIDDFEVRLRNVQGALLQTFLYALSEGDVDFKEIDKALEIALGMIGVTPSKAKQLCSTPLQM
jgi:AcrR family transcriptional regulator